MSHTTKQPKFKTFSKYDFVKSYIATTKDEKIKAEKEREATIIADAIENNQNMIFENLATKDDLKTLQLLTKQDIKALEISTKHDIKALEVDMKNMDTSLRKEMKNIETSLRQEMKILEISLRQDMKSLEYRLTIKLTAIMAALLTFLPLATDFIRGIFKL